MLSVMGGYIESIADFNSPNTLTLPQNGSATFTGGTVAASATYMNGGFFIDALLKADFLSMNVANIPGALCSGGLPTLFGITAKSTTWGTVANVGYRFEAGRYFIEPIGSVEWTNNHIGDINLAAAQVVEQFKNDRVDVGGGARVGGVVMDDRVHYLEGSFVGRVWDIATDPNKVTFSTLGRPSSCMTACSPGPMAKPASSSIGSTATPKFNNQFNFFTGKAGLRYAF